ncbi:hypothetical protein Tco_0577784 [Tanacetum coccineum]
MKGWEELIRENVSRLGGHQDHLSACLAHMLYCIIAEEQYNLAYFFAKQIKRARATPTANLPYGMFLTHLFRHVMKIYPHLDNGIYNVIDRVMRPLALKQTQKPRSDHGMPKARHSVSSSSAHHFGSLSHQEIDGEDEDDTKTPLPKHQLLSPSAPNAPLKTPSSRVTSSSFIATKLKSPSSSTSPSTNGYLNSPISPPPRVPPPPPTQENKPTDINLTFLPITPLDIQFNTPSPSMPSPPLFGHPISWNLLEAHGATLLCCIHNCTLIFGLRDEL